MTFSAPLENKSVQVVGLAQRADLNGKTGKAVAFDRVNDRYHVKLYVSGEVIALKPLNVVPFGSSEGTSTRSEPHRSDYWSDFSTATAKFEIGLASLVLIITSLFDAPLTVSGSLFALTLTATLLFPNIRRTELYRGCKKIESDLGDFVGSCLGSRNISGAGVLVAVAALSLLYKHFESNSYRYHHHMPGGFSLGNVSVFTLMMLALMIYRLDIPRNGLAAFSRLHVFELIWLWNTLQQLFGGRRARNHRRHDYDYGSAGFGRGYGYGTRGYRY
mmetsp:Transcript_210/g.266  ORF Transcript_210/g.266 Transcript_210/m.266 type:complete len:274 (-) Transcript_210:855-1676(-)